MEETKEAITRVIETINQTPFIFNSESDIQGLIYSELLKEYDTKHKLGLFDCNGKEYLTNLVHQEYFAGEGGRIDIVVFDKDEISKIDTNWLVFKSPEKKGYSSVRLQDAIEIKINIGGADKNLEIRLKKDIERLTELLNTEKIKSAHFVFIVRWLTKRKDITKRIIEAKEIAKKACEDEGIQFYCNNFEKLFK